VLDQIRSGRNLPVPDFWRGTVEDVDQALSGVTCGEVLSLRKSAGGRQLRAVAYGKQSPLHRTANLNSAFGASVPRAYVAKEKRQPSLMLVGGTHGSEMEGIVGLVNLIHVMESGCDLLGRSWGNLRALAEGVRLTVLPCLNPDGRARVRLKSYVGETAQTYRYWMQGTHADGTLYSWPEVKEFHPIQDVGFLGGYFNDDHINPMHDDFFTNPCAEVLSLMEFADSEAPDLVVLLHSAADSPFHFCSIAHLPSAHQEAIYRLSGRVASRMAEQQLPFRALPGPQLQQKGYSEQFNLPRALHHHCGAATLTIESCAGIEADQAELELEWQQILDGHFILFEELLTGVKADFRKYAQPFFDDSVGRPSHAEISDK
jgi:hypothetical protein